VVIVNYQNVAFLEFFALLLAEILKPDYGMFQYNEDTGYHQFNPVQFQETEKEYLLLGMLLGKLGPLKNIKTI
jgi:hypothetical protein